jgi:hypothetical protein
MASAVMFSYAISLSTMKKTTVVRLLLPPNEGDVTPILKGHPSLFGSVLSIDLYPHLLIFCQPTT